MLLALVAAMASATLNGGISAVCAFTPSRPSTTKKPLSPSHALRLRSLRRPSSFTSYTKISLSDEPSNIESYDGSTLPPSSLRRQCLSSLLLPFLTTAFSPDNAYAESPSASEGRVFVEGIVTLKKGTEFNYPTPDATSKGPALYITAKPESISAAPKTLYDALVGRYGGKAPPVLTARFPLPSSTEGESVFPFSFQLTEMDVTEEGSFNNDNNTMDNQPRSYWWTNEPLVISARLDSDGIAATRDPEDLVGRTSGRVGATKEDGGGVVLELQGRGLFGKSVTKKK